MLKEKEIVLGVTGGIAAYKAAEFVRLLVKEGAHVHVVMTQNAQEFVTPLTFQTLSGNPVVTDPFTLLEDSQNRSYRISRSGRIDRHPSCDCQYHRKDCQWDCRRFSIHHGDGVEGTRPFCPFDECQYVGKQALQKNIQILLERGYHFIEPGEGELACHWYGKGRLAELDEVMEKIGRSLLAKGFKRRKNPDHRWSNSRADRSRPIHHQSFFGEDGICLGKSGEDEEVLRSF